MARRAFVFFVLLAWCGVLLAGRVWRSHQLTYAFLVWNLFLVPRPPIPLWYDVALLLSCAGTGLLLGYSSLADVQDAVTRRFGGAVGWCTALAALLLSGFGVYLGRFLRWNSWDPIRNPAALLARLGGYGLNPMSHPRTVAVTFVYGVCFALGYAALHAIGTTTMRSR